VREAAGPLAARGGGGRVALLLALAVLAAAVAFALPPIPQDPRYHAFADTRRLLGVPHALNVLSNIPFVVVGLLGLAAVARADTPLRSAWERRAWAVVFAGILLTGPGSAWYHLAPTNASLVWDRLPMTVAFMGLLAVVIAERVGLGAGRWLLPPLLLLGVASVAHWALGEARGAGDLRLYGLVQFFPLVAIPLMLALFPARYTRGADVLVAAGWYGVAKVLEALDARVFAAGGLVSGHTLKHLASAIAMAWLLAMVRRRRPVADPA
jgi:hypothetical protein